MSTDEMQASPKWFSRVAWVLFVWNLLGLMAFVMQVTMSAEQLAALPEAQRTLYEGYASWATLAFGVAVIGGTAGSLLLALCKALALPLLVGSLVGVVIQKIHDLVVIDSVAVFGPTAVIMPALVFVLAVLLVVMAQKGKANHWIT